MKHCTNSLNASTQLMSPTDRELEPGKLEKALGYIPVIGWLLSVHLLLQRQSQYQKYVNGTLAMRIANKCEDPNHSPDESCVCLFKELVGAKLGCEAKAIWGSDPVAAFYLDDDLELLETVQSLAASAGCDQSHVTDQLVRMIFDETIANACRLITEEAKKKS